MNDSVARGPTSRQKQAQNQRNNNSNSAMNYNNNSNNSNDNMGYVAPQSQHNEITQQQPHQPNIQYHPHHHPRDSITGSYPSRRVTIGGSSNMPSNDVAAATTAPPSAGMDRRGSMASMNFNMDDFFTRRPSLGDIDAFFGGSGVRRDSIDSSSAAMDAVLLDYTRRRYSMAPNNNDVSSLASNSMLPGGSVPHGSERSSQHQQQQASTVSAIAAQQQQLQQQQREIEQRQRELEIQRQQLIASMQERSRLQQQQAIRGNTSFGRQHHRGGATESLGLGSVHSQQHPHMGSPLMQPHNSLSLSQQQHHQRRNSLISSSSHTNASINTASQQGGRNAQNWWICQFCNSKAYASHEEAMDHERICPMNMARQSGPNNPNTSAGLDMFMPNQSQRSQYSQRSNYTQDSIMVSNRHNSLGMDSSGASYEHPQISHGPFALMEKPMALAMPSDKDWLTPLHCFVRRHCVEVFTASEQEVATPSKGKRKPIQVGQVGIRCPHCHNKDNEKARERGSVYYPTTISSIYNATMNLLQRHLHSCTAVPDDVMRRYETLKSDDARSGTSKRYWVESALSLGLVDTPNGIRFSALQPPPLPSLSKPQESASFNAARRNSNEFFSSQSNAIGELKKSEEEGDKDNEAEGGEEKDADDSDLKMPADEGETKVEQELTDTAPLVVPDDKPYATEFSYHLLSQMQPCLFTEADRLGKRKGLPPGFPGLACRHCFGGYGSGRFFPSSIKTLSDTSKTLNVLHNHMMRCRKCPAEVRETLDKLRGSHDDERAKMKFGSQKAFFARIWDRLHGKDSVHLKRKATPQPSVQLPQQRQQQPQMHHFQQQGMPYMHGGMGMQGPPMHNAAIYGAMGGSMPVASMPYPPMTGNVPPQTGMMGNDPMGPLAGASEYKRQRMM